MSGICHSFCHQVAEYGGALKDQAGDGFGYFRVAVKGNDQSGNETCHGDPQLAGSQLADDTNI